MSTSLDSENCNYCGGAGDYVDLGEITPCSNCSGSGVQLSGLEESR